MRCVLILLLFSFFCNCKNGSFEKKRTENVLFQFRNFNEKDRFFLDYYFGMNTKEVIHNLNKDLRMGRIFRRKFDEIIIQDLVNVNGKEHLTSHFEKVDDRISNKRSDDSLNIYFPSERFNILIDSLELAFEFNTESGSFYVGFYPYFENDSLVSIELQFPIRFERSNMTLMKEILIYKEMLANIYSKKYSNLVHKNDIFQYFEKNIIITIDNGSCTYENKEYRQKILQLNQLEKEKEIMKGKQKVMNTIKSI